jgi:hypothetical protein
MDYSFEVQPPGAEQQLRELIIARLTARTHWVFLPSIECIPLLLALETKFYSHSPADFQTYILPVRGAYEVTVASKRRCNAQQLAAFLNSGSLSHELDGHLFTSIDLMAHDVIVLANQNTAGTHKNFYQWLGLLPGGVP